MTSRELTHAKRKLDTWSLTSRKKKCFETELFLNRFERIAPYNYFENAKKTNNILFSNLIFKRTCEVAGTYSLFS